MKNLHTTFLLHSFIIHLDVATGSKGDKDVHPLWLRHSIYGIYIEYMHKIPQKQRDLHKNFDMFHSTKKKNENDHNYKTTNKISICENYLEIRKKLIVQ